MSTRTFGLTITDGPVQGKAIQYAVTETGTFAALPSDVDYSAWDALSDDERAAITTQTRATSFPGWSQYMPKKEGE